MKRCCSYDNMKFNDFNRTMECKTCHTVYTDEFLLENNLKKYARRDAASYFEEPELTPIEKLDKLCSEYEYFQKHGRLPDWG